MDEGSTGTLDGSASTTSSGTITTYEWSLPGSPPAGVQITDADTSTPEAVFDATGADVSSDTDVTVQLTVSNNQGDSDTTTTTVTVRDTDGGGGSGNQDPSVTVDTVEYNSGTVTVDFTPDDQDGNLDSATIVVDKSNGKEADRRTIDISGKENQQVTETFSGGQINDGNSPYTVTVTVEDTDGATSSDSGQS